MNDGPGTPPTPFRPRTLFVPFDYYAKNRDAAKSMTDREYWEHIDGILDEINRIKKALAEEDALPDL